MQPWGLTSWRGRWYLTGFDLDRGAERVFRLGRVVGAVTTVGKPGAYAVPADHRPRVLVAGAWSRWLRRLPWLPGGDSDQTFWAPVSVPMIGGEFGTYTLPEIEDKTVAALRAVPGVVGVNNHMGSKLSEEEGPMTAVIPSGATVRSMPRSTGWPGT